MTPPGTRSLPEWADIVNYLRESTRPRVVDVLRTATAARRPTVQPRCGVGSHAAMVSLLRELEKAGPGILSVTIDSHTRLKQFDTAERLLARAPEDLNGYPLVAHGWQRGRELGESVSVPLEVRHGSPDARELFTVAVAAGITSFEGGGISYNLPYSKDVPIRHSLQTWEQVDATCGELARAGVLIDRELFGTLTAVLVPPSISLAVTLLEAIAAVRQGVRCVSLAYPQGGEVHQDVAALRCIRPLVYQYIGSNAEVYPVLHEFMGDFPRTPEFASTLILCGGLVARLGAATKVISKTVQESFGIPNAAANALGIRTTILGASELFDFVKIDEARVDEEMYWIRREVSELVDPILDATDLSTGISLAFECGRLDIPFSASVHARSEVVPGRDRHGAIRYTSAGKLPLSATTLRRNEECLRDADVPRRRTLIDAVTADIFYFIEQEAKLLPDIADNGSS